MKSNVRAIILFIILVSCSSESHSQLEADTFQLNQFGDDFLWGTACAAYQIEGAWDEGGKGLSVWDEFTHRKGNIHENETGDVAVDFYHRYKEDIALNKKMGFDVFRFSIELFRFSIILLCFGLMCYNGLGMNSSSPRLLILFYLFVLTLIFVVSRIEAIAYTRCCAQLF